MQRFSDSNIIETVKTLLSGGDYRTNIINAINAEFFDFATLFFKEIVLAKIKEKDITIEWYRKCFINAINKEDIAIYAGLNNKTIANIHGSTNKELVIKVANDNLDYLTGLLTLLEEDEARDWHLTLKLEYNNVAVELSITESLLVINALATKKIALRGGVWSSIGKTIEKPLMIEMCKQCNVPEEFIVNKFTRDKNKKVDREVDFYLYNKEKTKKYRIEVKLMGKGNPESADVIFARDTDIIVADTLSEQNKNQILANSRKYVELKNNNHSIKDFANILTVLDVPHRL